MIIRLLLILLLLPSLAFTQFSSRMRMAVQAPGSTAPGGGGGDLPRNGVVMSSTFEGNVQCTDCEPADPGTPFPGGWNVRPGDFLDSFSNFQHRTDTAVRKIIGDSWEGNASVQFHVNKTDPTASGSKRAEITVEYISDTGDVWYGYKMKMVNWVNDASSPEHVFQWHPTSGTGSATLRMETHGNNYMVVYGNSDSAQYYIDTGIPIVNGVWVDFVWHVKWSTFGTIIGGPGGGNGTIEVWIGGVKVVNMVGNVRTDQRVSGQTGQYLKMGWNKYGYTLGGSPGQPSRIARFDAFRIARTPLGGDYNAVAPSGDQLAP